MVSKFISMWTLLRPLFLTTFDVLMFLSETICHRERDVLVLGHRRQAESGQSAQTLDEHDAVMLVTAKRTGDLGVGPT